MISTGWKLNRVIQNFKIKIMIFIKNLFKILTRPFGPILMITNPRMGLAIILSGFLHPNIILSGLIGAILTFLLFEILKIENGSSIKESVYCNSILLGLYIGSLYVLDPVSFLLIFLTMGFNIIVCFSFDSIFSNLKLPLLSLPFSIVAIIINLSTKKYTSLAHANYYFYELFPDFFKSLPYNLGVLLKSLGTFFCIPDPAFGFLILIGVFLYSPIIAVFLTSGFYIGQMMDQFFTFTSQEFSHHYYYFNFSLIFTAIAGVFLTPSLYSILWAIFATLITVLISGALASLFSIASLPIMALPFNLGAFLILKTVQAIASKKLNPNTNMSPEDSIESNRLLKFRHRSPEIGVFLPVAGTWKIQQGFDDAWTHKGRWKHGLDFVIEQDQKTYRNQGLELDDYFAFGKKIYSPISGIVVDFISTRNDNNIEEVDNVNNWGNYLIIKSDWGFYVKLAHLKKNSIRVPLFSYVEAGQEIAECGNSGYSREPHLHLQIQLLPHIGAPTVPFHLLNFINTNSLTGFFHEIPQKGDSVSPFVFNFSLYRNLNFKLDEEIKWKRTDLSSNSCEEFIFYHKLDPKSGRNFWTDGQSKLYYHILGSKFYFYDLQGETYSPIWDLYLSAPSIPLILPPKICYTETLPLKLTKSKLQRLFLSFLNLFFEIYEKNLGKYEIDPESLTITGTIQNGRITKNTFLKIDLVSGITEFISGKYKYERI